MRTDNPERCVYTDVTRRRNVSPSRESPQGFVTSGYNANPYNTVQDRREGATLRQED